MSRALTTENTKVVDCNRLQSALKLEAREAGVAYSTYLICKTMMNPSSFRAAIKAFPRLYDVSEYDDIKGLGALREDFIDSIDNNTDIYMPDYIVKSNKEKKFFEQIEPKSSEPGYRPAENLDCATDNELSMELSAIIMELVLRERLDLVGPAFSNGLSPF